jgi:hypothetical protein
MSNVFFNVLLHRCRVIEIPEERVIWVDLLSISVKGQLRLSCVYDKSGGELLEMRLLDSHLLDTFGSKSIARHKFYQLLESS